jgi:AraC-like DNA-binding protein
LTETLRNKRTLATSRPRKRLSRAVELLCEAGQRHRKIADIAFEVGFKDLSYFNPMFRRKYAGTPTELRQATGGTRERQRPR